ncbi:glycosyltransferase family 4 protein [Aciditerrimonas ferrireducens]|jgi:glycosyltransferase involved in cell wall biosynthesis|uniref:glycosyltransferase family 4 protein n=1 Tax=Aciditerrimonas ferrireducens TaxID=667306 RepID=UPI002003AF3A|nr:glycosyltransferase family 4 protein [Aciditerrimonas ferrireducens]MCK4176077.1 glycosyltransferase family 4 protein [Aciditerrimonas ferrireducens]
MTEFDRSRRQPPSIWLVVHGFPPAEFTGTPLIAHGYATELVRRGWHVVVVEPSPDGMGRCRARDATDGVAGRDGRGLLRRRFLRREPPGGGLWSLEAAARRDPMVVAEVRRALLEDRPDLVHVVDNVDLPLVVPEVAGELGIPVVRTVACAEDLCALIAPVSPRSDSSGFCRAPLRPERCLGCLEATVPLRGRGEADWAMRLLRAKRARAAWQFWNVYDRILFPSQGFRAYFERSLPLPKARVRVVPMGFDHRPFDCLRRRSAEPARKPLTFLFLATGHPAKGVGTVVEAFLAPAVAEREDWRLVTAGGGERNLLGPLRHDRRVTDIGPYDIGALPELLKRADIGISASVFETFHRVTREYLLGGLPVLAAKTFGIMDVVRNGLNGLWFSPNEPGELTRAIVEVLEDPALVERLRAGAEQTEIRSLEDEVEELISIYAEVVDASGLARA